MSRRQNQQPRQNSSVHSSMYLESGYNKSMVTSSNILETLAKRRTQMEHRKIESLMKNSYTYMQGASSVVKEQTSKHFPLTFQTE